MVYIYLCPLKHLSGFGALFMMPLHAPAPFRYSVAHSHSLLTKTTISINQIDTYTLTLTHTRTHTPPGAVSSVCVWVRVRVRVRCSVAQLGPLMYAIKLKCSAELVAACATCQQQLPG